MPLAILALLGPTSSLRLRLSITFSERLSSSSSSFFFFPIILLIYLLAVWGIHCCVSFSPVVVSRGYFLFVVLRLLFEVASLVAEHSRASWLQ